MQSSELIIAVVTESSGSDFIGPRVTKNQQISLTMAYNEQRRAKFTRKVYELKVSRNKLSTKKIEALQGTFLEAKWIKNWHIGLPNLSYLEEVGHQVPVRVFNNLTSKCDIIEIKTLRFIGSQLKQSVVHQVMQDVYNLNKIKKTGRKTGRLKFISKMGSIELKQHGKTHTVTPRGVRVQNIGLLKVSGLDQLFTDGKPIGEFASGRLIQRASGYYIKVMVYLVTEPAAHTKPEIGTDLGVKTPITLSTGEEPDLSVKLPKSLRRISHRLSKAKKGSKRRYKAKHHFAVEHERYANQKLAKAQKFLSQMKAHSHVIMQDDYIAAWKHRWGRKCQEASLGIITSCLKKRPNSVIISRFLPTTKQCPKCHINNNIPLSQRIYACDCGFQERRDVKGAKTTKCYGLYALGHPGKELIGLSAEELTTVFSTYEYASRPIDAEDASDFSPR